MQVPTRPKCDVPVCKEVATMFMSKPEGGSVYLCLRHYDKTFKTKTTVKLEAEREEENTYSV